MSLVRRFASTYVPAISSATTTLRGFTSRGATMWNRIPTPSRSVVRIPLSVGPLIHPHQCHTALVTVFRFHSTSGSDHNDNDKTTTKHFGISTTTQPPDSSVSSSAASTEGAAHTSSSDTEAPTVASLSPEDQALLKKAVESPNELPSSRLGGQGIGPAAGEMMAIFTCAVCDMRSVKRFSKHCYEKGIVIVECPGCKKRHLLADNLGWFDDHQKNIVDILKAKGEEVLQIGYKSPEHSSSQQQPKGEEKEELLSFEVDGKEINLAEVLEMARQEGVDHEGKPQDMK